MPLAEIKCIFCEHEVYLQQMLQGEKSVIVLPKQTAVNIAREIVKAYPGEALKALYEDVKNRTNDSDQH